MAAYTQIFANNCSTTLASPITSATQTTISLTSAANLPTIPTGGIFALTLNDAATQTVFEILYVTAISGSTLTVERGQDGTTATTWLAGDYAYSAVTRATLGNFAQIGNTVTFPYGVNTSALTSTGAVSGASVASTGAVTGASGAFTGVVTATGVEVNGGYLPPVYSNSGLAVGSNSHIVSGSATITFSGTTTTSVTVNLSGSAVFASGSSYSIQATINNNSTNLIAVSATPLSATQFLITCQSTTSLTQTLNVYYFCIGQ